MFCELPYGWSVAQEDDKFFVELLLQSSQNESIFTWPETHVRFAAGARQQQQKDPRSVNDQRKLQPHFEGLTGGCVESHADESQELNNIPVLRNTSADL